MTRNDEAVWAPKLAPFDRGAFEAALQTIRSLMRSDPETFEPEMKRVAAEAGVVIVIAGIPKRARRMLPRTIDVVPLRGEPDELTTYEGIPATTLACALRDARGKVMTDRLIAATREGAARGLLRRQEANDVLGELGGNAHAPVPSSEPIPLLPVDHQRPRTSMRARGSTETDK